MNEVKLVVTAQNRSKSELAAPKKQLTEIEKSAMGVQKSAARMNDELANGFRKAGGTTAVEESLTKLSKSADDAFDGLKDRFTKATKDMEDAATVKIKAEVDKDRFKSSLDGLGGFDFDIGSGLGPKLAAAFGKGIDLAGAGAKGAASFVSGLSEGVKGQHPAVQAAVYGSLAVAVAAAAPLAGGALAGGIIAGFGAGIGGLGIVAAAQNEKIKENYSNLWASITADMQSRSTVMEGVLERSAGRAQTISKQTGSSFEKAFDRLAPGVERLFDGALRSVSAFGPYLDRLASGASAVFSDLGSRLPGIVDEMAGAFADLADTVGENPEALGDFIATIGEFVEAGAAVLETLTVMHEGNKMFLGLLSKPFEWVGLKDVESDVKGTTGAMTELSKVAAETRLDPLTASFEALSKAESETARWADEIRVRYERLLGISPMFEESVQGVNDRIRGLLDDFSKTGAAADGFGKDLVNADGTINTLTANGSKLQDALTDLRGNFTDMAGSVKELESRGLSHADAVARVNEQYAIQSQRLLDNHAKFGLTRDQMGKVLEAAGLISGKKMDMWVALDTRQFYGELPSLLATRTLYIEPRLTSTGIGVGAPKLSGPNKAHAAGGISSGGWATVGEHGPERVRLPGGSMVYPNTSSPALLAQQGGGSGGAVQPIQVNLVLDGKVLATQLINPLKGVVRVRGGDHSVFG